MIGAPLICRRKRCHAAARWIAGIVDHPNGGTSRAPYCHEHAEEELHLLWDDAPRAYTKSAIGPFDPEQLRAALGREETLEHLAAKQRHAAELEAEQQARERQQ